MNDENRFTSKRGFAGMSPERRREIAAKGGSSIPPEKRSFSKNRDLAAWAGSKGGAMGGKRGAKKPKGGPS